MRRTIRCGARRGFTMVEIILVVVIIMTLASLVGPRLVGRTRSARINATKIQMSSIKTSLGEFEVNAGRFPTNSEGLEALVKKPSGMKDTDWPDKYMDKVPKDAWGNPFQYHYPSEHGGDFDLVSPGPDGKLNTDDDITSYDEETEGEQL